jgi:hypothetical protein
MSKSNPAPPPKRARLQDVRVIELPKIPDPRGNLTFIEGGRHVPFEIQRVFYLYDVPGGESRGGHALKTTEQFLIAVSGSFTVVVDSGGTRQRYFLNRSYFGLYLPPMIWREIEDFSSGAVCLVLASRPYDAGDYYQDYQEFLEASRKLQ